MIRAFVHNRFQLPILFFGLILFRVMGWASPCLAQGALLKKIRISSSPLALTLDLSRKVPVKVIQIEGKEVLVALKNVRTARDFRIQGKKGSGIADIGFQDLDGDVLAIVVSGTMPFAVKGHSFDASGSRLSVNLGSAAPPKVRPPVVSGTGNKSSKKTGSSFADAAKTEKKAVVSSASSAVPVKTKPPENTAVQAEKKPRPSSGSVPEPASVLANTVNKMTPPVYHPRPQPVGVFQGSLEDIYGILSKELCMEEPTLQDALVLLKKHAYEKSAEILDQYLLNERARCNGPARFLRAIAHYRGKEALDDTIRLNTLHLFQEAVLVDPASPLNAFAFTAMGMIHLDLKNPYASLGYLNLVKHRYPDYPGMPEVKYHLARIYETQGFLDKAKRYYQEVFQAPVRNVYVNEAGFGYAKTLFENKQFFDALSILNYLTRRNPKQAYESPEFLLYMGNANFELGYSRAAREDYIRGINVFPDIAQKDILLSRIGDTYAMEDNRDKAIKFYELVRNSFPESSGYITASMGMARYLPTDAERVKIYEMIKSEFPKNTYARIAMMRLAEMYQKNGEYNKCIREIEDLLSTHPKGLRYEAVKLMQKAYEALFQSRLREGDYTGVLQRYEQEQIKIDKMESKKLSLYVGSAYLEAKLYEQAFNHLINSYKRYKRNQRPPELLFGLGTAMDETRRDEDALKLFAGFVRQFPAHTYRVPSLVRMGEIYMNKGKFALAEARLKKAFSISRDDMEKADILFLQAQVSEKANELSKAVRYRRMGIEHIAAAPGTHYPLLAKAYKDLGAVQARARAYIHAAEAYARALDFSQEEEGKDNIGFLLGDAYQKGNIVTKAREAFEQVARNYDSVWARLAKQRLETLSLAQGLTNS